MNLYFRKCKTLVYILVIGNKQTQFVNIFEFKYKTMNTNYKAHEENY